MDKDESVVEDASSMTIESGQRRRGVDTAEHIAGTAMQLFLERGYDEVTVEDVAQAAGVSRRTVFRHFSSKDELPFADHARRQDLARALLEQPGRGVNPIDDIIEVTERTLADFLSTPELVLQRYALTRLVPQLAQREVLEHEKYLVHSRRHLRLHLPSTRHAFEPMAIAAFIDGMHRSALSSWISSGGTTDAIADLRAGTEWAQRALAAAGDDSRTTSLLAVVPNTAAARLHLQALVDMDPRPAT